jgi:hypothetical protein
MRVGVFLLFLLFALAMASSPAVAQVPSAPDRGAERAAKEAEKAAEKEAEKAAEKAAREAEKAAEKAAKEAAKAARKDDDEEDEPEDVGAPGTDEEEPGDVDEPADDGGSGAPGSGKTEGPGGPSSQSDPKTSAHALAAPSTRSFEARPSRQNDPSTEPACTEGCASPTDVAAEGQGDSILAAESGGELQAVGAGAFSNTESAIDGAGVLMLFALMALGLAVGTAGGLIALRGRLRED